MVAISAGEEGAQTESGTVIRTPDQRLRVFVSSTLQELADERAAVKAAIESLHLSPVLFELGARPHAAATLYRSYLAQSHIFVGIYWQRYGWVAPDMDISGLEDEYLLAGDMPKLLYFKNPAPEREERLRAMMRRMQGDAVSYKYFETADELRELVANDLALLLTERFEQSVQREERVAAVRSERSRSFIPVLPAPLIGRDDAVAQVQEMVQRLDVRLLTLTGPGGVGKSSLALAVATGLEGVFADGIYWVPLAALRTPDLVISALAHALDVRERGGHPLQESLADFLRERELLLLLDNFEQVLAAAPLIAELLAAAPGLTVLVTSRAPLRLRAEHEIVVPPLPIPEETEQLSENAAVQLFVDRAQAASPTFALTAENAGAVQEIVSRLDGLPLAIELAAARSKLLPPRAILNRLDSRLKLLTGGAQDLPARQQTMRNTIDWSYSLLDEPVQALFAQLAVFSGGFTLPAAEAVCHIPERGDLLEEVNTLLDNSLLRREAGPGDEPRFSMLATLREYALERLAESREEAQLRRRHAHYFAKLGQDAMLPMHSGASELWLDRLEAEYDNLRVALDWFGSEPAEMTRGWELVISLNWFWYRRGFLNEGRQQYERLLAMSRPEGVDALWAIVLVQAGVIAMWQSDLHTAAELMDEGLPRLRAGTEPVYRGMALFTRGVLAVNQGDDATAVRVLEEARAAMEQIGQQWFLAMTLLHLGNVALNQDDEVTARERMEKTLALGTALGERWIMASALNNLGEISRYLGDYETAATYYQRSEALFQALNSAPDLARARHSAGYVALARGETRAAYTLFMQGLDHFQQLGLKRGIAECLAGIAVVLATEGNHELAAALFAAAEARFAELGAGVWPADRREHARSVATVRTALGEEAFTGARDRGADLSIEEAIAFARCAV
jgi:predicted ATPase